MTEKQKKPTGRPFSPNPKCEQIHIWIEHDVKIRLFEAAKQAKLTMSDFVRELILKAIEKED